ncbi:YmaF family protein [Paenibacillus sp. FSL W8-0187]|uniref:YmaF family protein n=1 Tax=Paenibacillus sp. FSL W8-0187 TaxID=2921710 RepID=UPI0030DA741C
MKKGKHSLKKAHLSQTTDRFQHRMSGNTSINVGHRHRYSGITGAAINGQGPRHFHRFRQMTQFADGHRHLLSGRTSVPIRVSGSTLHRHGIIIENIKRM